MDEKDRKMSEMTCNYGSKCERDRKADYFAEFDGITDEDYSRETSEKYYGWWGYVCAPCLEEIKKLVKKHNGVLRYLPAEKVKPVPIKGSKWKDHDVDWSKAMVIGNEKLLKGK